MRAIIETVFDIFYLVTVLTVGIRMIRGSKAGTQYRLFGLMAVVKQGYAYLGYAALITLFIPIGDSRHDKLNRNITRTSSILSRFLPYTSYDNPYPDTISHHFP